VIDRASTFANPQIISLLQEKFVTVAIDQAYQRRQQDGEGDFYRLLANQGPHRDFERGTTQGLYIGTADGKLLGYTNHRSPDRVAQFVRDALRKFRPEDVTPREATRVDPRWNVKLPAGGLAVRVQAKVLGGYESTDDPIRTAFQEALSRDNLWIRPDEHQSLVRGEFPATLAKRIARYHLVDNTRGEPPMWSETEVRSAQIDLSQGNVSGHAKLETDDKSRGYDCQIRGVVEVSKQQVTRLDLVVKGEFWGHGTYTQNPPKGRFPLAISFTIADGSDVADVIPPQGSRGWVEGYLGPL